MYTTLPASAAEAVLRSAGADSLADITTSTSPTNAAEAVPCLLLPILLLNRSPLCMLMLRSQLQAPLHRSWLSICRKMAVLHRDNNRSVAVFLCYYLVTLLYLTKTRAAEFISTIIGKSDCTIRQWSFSRMMDSFSQELSRGSISVVVYCGNEELNKNLSNISTQMQP